MVHNRGMRLCFFCTVSLDGKHCLQDIAYLRSGDKGNTSNIGESYDLLSHDQCRGHNSARK